MTTAKRSRLWKIAIASILVISVWPIAGYYLIGLSEKHEWLSSFIEIAFALNTSMSVAKVRSILLRPLLQKCYNLLEEVKVTDETKTVNEQTTENLKNEAGEIYAKFERRVMRELNWIVKSGILFAALSVLVLITDCPDWGIRYVPVLLLPVLIYVMDVFVEYNVVAEEFAASCEKVIENKEVEREKKEKESIEQVMKKLEKTEENMEGTLVD